MKVIEHFCELYGIIKGAWRSGRRKYFLNNLSCGLRSGHYPQYKEHDHSMWGKCLFSLGVWMLDPLGKRFDDNVKWHGLGISFDGHTMEQWFSHPFPWVRAKAKKWACELEMQKLDAYSRKIPPKIRRN